MAERKSGQELAQDLLYAQTTEEVQAEKIINFWKKYKGLLALGLILILGATLGVEVYQNWRKGIRLGESELYEEAAILNAQGQTDKAVEVYRKLENAQTAYAYLSGMRIAGIYFETGKEAEGIAELERLRTLPKIPADLKAVVTFSYVAHLLETGNAKMLQEMLSPYLTSGNVWYGSAAELYALLLMREGKEQEAATFLATVLQEKNLSETVLERLRILQAAVTKE